ncbi:MAG: hypothetical protein ACK4IK_10495 [Bacteroidia bacterium]
MKNTFFIVLTLFYIVSYAQKEDVLYLKNNSILKGKIKSYNENNTLTFITYSGNNLIISKNEIDSIKKEKAKHLDIFYSEKEQQNKKLKFISSFNFVSGFHENFRNTKTISNQFLIDAGIRIQDRIKLGVGIGVIQYMNLPPNEYKLINGASDYTVMPDKNNFTNSSVLYHLPVYSNLSFMLLKAKNNNELYVSAKAGYIYYAPEKFYGTIRIDRRNNAEVYNLSFTSEYNKRYFVHPELMLYIPTFNNTSKYKIGLGYYLDLLTINYNFRERTFINTNYMLPSQGYWQTREYTQKDKASLGFITLNLGLSF